VQSLTRVRADQPAVSPENKEKAAQAKVAGNASFSAGDFTAAVAHFTAAIAADPSDHVFFSNRRCARAGGLRAHACARSRAERAPPAPDPGLSRAPYSRLP
jgi:Flp pilus assembly protein TadD